MTATEARRREVLALAQEHDFLILEDDPYYFLYFGAAPRPPSYFALEREALPAVGRVLRFDSLSKILSAGIRIGFACGPAPIMDVIDMHVRTRPALTPRPALPSPPSLPLPIHPSSISLCDGVERG